MASSVAPAQSPFQVFVCYASENLRKARSIQEALRKAGLRAFVAKDDLVTDFYSEVMDIIEGCRVIVILADSKLNKSPSCRKEVISAHEANLRFVVSIIERDWEPDRDVEFPYKGATFCSSWQYVRFSLSLQEVVDAALEYIKRADAKEAAQVPADGSAALAAGGAAVLPGPQHARPPP